MGHPFLIYGKWAEIVGVFIAATITPGSREDLEVYLKGHIDLISAFDGGHHCTPLKGLSVI